MAKKKTTRERVAAAYMLLKAPRMDGSHVPQAREILRALQQDLRGEPLDVHSLVRRREELAAYAHEAWAGWMKHLFSKCRIEKGERVIPEWAVDRWMRQMSTDYADLPEKEKESDRKEADRMLKITDVQQDRREKRDESIPAKSRTGKEEPG